MTDIIGHKWQQQRQQHRKTTELYVSAVTQNKKKTHQNWAVKSQYEIETKSEKYYTEKKKIETKIYSFDGTPHHTHHKFIVVSFSFVFISVSFSVLCSFLLLLCHFHGMMNTFFSYFWLLIFGFSVTLKFQNCVEFFFFFALLAGSWIWIISCSYGSSFIMFVCFFLGSMRWCRTQVATIWRWKKKKRRISFDLWSLVKLLL